MEDSSAWHQTGSGASTQGQSRARLVDLLPSGPVAVPGRLHAPHGQTNPSVHVYANSRLLLTAAHSMYYARCMYIGSKQRAGCKAGADGAREQMTLRPRGVTSIRTAFPVAPQPQPQPPQPPPPSYYRLPPPRPPAEPSVPYDAKPHPWAPATSTLTRPDHC